MLLCYVHNSKYYNNPNIGTKQKSKLGQVMTTPILIQVIERQYTPWSKICEYENNYSEEWLLVM